MRKQPCTKRRDSNARLPRMHANNTASIRRFVAKLSPECGRAPVRSQESQPLNLAQASRCVRVRSASLACVNRALKATDAGRQGQPRCGTHRSACKLTRRSLL